MKIKITRGRLSDALKRVSGIADGRNSLPILANVWVSARKDGLTFMTTNLDITLATSEKECQVVEEGETTIPMRKLEQIVSVLPNEDVTIETDAKERTVLASGGVRMTVAGLPAKDFPPLAEEKNPAIYTMKGASLLGILRKSAYAMSRDDTRKTLQSVLLEVSGPVVRAIATDGRRLSYGEAECVPPANAGKDDEVVQFVIPSMTVGILQRLLDSASDITIKAESGRFTMTQCDGRDVVYTKLVDGVFPNYKQVIPEEGDADVKVDRNEMLAMLNRSLVMASDSDPYVKMKFGGNTIETSAKGENDSMFIEPIPAKYEGKAFEICFNPKYIMDCLKSLDSDVVTFNTIQDKPVRPIIIKGESDKGLAIVMPLRIA